MNTYNLVEDGKVTATVKMLDREAEERNINLKKLKCPGSWERADKKPA